GVSARRVAVTVGSAALFAAGGAAAAALPAKVLVLTKGVLNAMLLTKLKHVTVVLLAAAVVGLAAGALVVPRLAAEPPAGAPGKGAAPGKEAADKGPPDEFTK